MHWSLFSVKKKKLQKQILTTLFIHGMLPGKSLCLKCGQADCQNIPNCSEFGIFSGFDKHLKIVHEQSNVVPGQA